MKEQLTVARFEANTANLQLSKLRMKTGVHKGRQLRAWTSHPPLEDT